MDTLSDKANCISKKVGFQIEEELPALSLIGIGGSFEDGVIIYNTVDFNVKGVLEKSEGIRIISRIVDLYTSTIYSENFMISYLKDHPFTYKNLEIGLHVAMPDGGFVNHPDIRIFVLSEGSISYRTMRTDHDGLVKRETYTKEPYEEAVARIRKGSQE